MLLSILIATLEQRSADFTRVCAELGRQIRVTGLEQDVEILAASDRGHASIGAKRNALIRSARGDYVCFVDDDDLLHERYVELIAGGLREDPAVDVIGLRGVMTFRGRRPRAFELSRRHPDYSSAGGTLRRPPHHCNPVRRSIAERYPFLEVDRHEDHDWALRLAADGVLRTERMVEDPLYHYRSRRVHAYQWALDRTERPRHALGLRTVNAVRRREARRRDTGVAAPPPAVHTVRFEK